MKTDKPHVYEIRVEGHLAARWSDWFEELAMQNDPGGETTLSGSFVARWRFSVYSPRSIA
jgi:hypothetical protein